jgi:hypothetical protein
MLFLCLGVLHYHVVRRESDLSAFEPDHSKSIAPGTEPATVQKHKRLQWGGADYNSNYAGRLPTVGAFRQPCAFVSQPAGMGGCRLS